jgi:hypothetical protein
VGAKWLPNVATPSHPGRPRKIEDRLEEALVQLFLDYKDMTIDEALEWLNEEFKVSVNKTTIKQNPLPVSSHS